MYLGIHIKTIAAQDDKSIHATAPQQKVPAPKSRKARKQIVEPLTQAMPVAQPQLAVAKDNAEELRRELEKAQATNSHLRNRIHGLLNVLRGKNRTIARMERELAAHSQDEKLTVDAIVNAKDQAKVS